MAMAARRRLALLEPTGEVFVNGLAFSYEDVFPGDVDMSFAQYMTAEEFQKAITKINDALQDHWPCLPCTSFAYGCCVCTLGLSFYCATAQVHEAETRVNMQIRRINDQANFKSRQIEWQLVRKWYRRASHIEISIANEAPVPKLPPSQAKPAVNLQVLPMPATEVIDGRVV
ncbi:hypothetical protein Poli38472_009133 [Pythium oligandrum]|uniref:Golgin subfamily A member 7/ERF4 domain-containing protein n=1 Tax=Pythium oligandrum TaxID=41045 RepID=A0A8K1FJI8_PYTOL|nr:hypothetical protein Poli38472_009133 [Pythium oligandrum]|eukprot:TMW64966.1 hypothetical protein Poli38472_009133 [Pythium oligandrum]